VDGGIALSGILASQAAEVAGLTRHSPDLAVEDREEDWVFSPGSRNR
jgi:hypothetical protein